MYYSLPRHLDTMPYKKDRFVVVDTITGKIVNDANGYGFKSRESAIKSTYYMDQREEIEETKKACKGWWNDHKEFADKFDDLTYMRWEDREQVTYKDFYSLLKKCDIDHKTLPYSPGLLMKYCN